MDLSKNGKLLYDLRKKKGFTQKQIAEKLGVVPKTVSKWERGRGFPDVSIISSLADILGVSERILLSGCLIENKNETGNVKKTKFYVCPTCGSFMQGTGEQSVLCCGKILEPLKAKSCDVQHLINISEIENDFFIEIDHEMTKEHYIVFLSCVTFDRVITVRTYPEQDFAVRIPKIYGGKLLCFCSKHGLYECIPKRNRE